MKQTFQGGDLNVKNLFYYIFIALWTMSGFISIVFAYAYGVR